jgi:hypothetical protein
MGMGNENTKVSFKQHLFLLIEKKQGHNNMIAIPTALIGFCGERETASFLSQLIYWCDKGKSPDGYIYKPYHEWNRETGLSEYHVKKSANKLKSLGLLDTKKKRANGHPTIHYRLNRKALESAITNFLSNDSEKVKFRNLNISECITEPTTEPTKNYGFNSKGLQSIPLSFKEYKKAFLIEEDTVKAIEYFLGQYERCRGNQHPNLKPEQWEKVCATLIYCSAERLGHQSIDYDLDALRAMIDKYFDTKFQDNCNYSIIHFNNYEIKMMRMYEAVYR